jgi:phage baseplate assembly protein W
MPAPAYRAFRFTHPDFAREGEPAGLRLGPGGGIEMVEADESVRQAVLLLLTTRPGERIMRPDYGCELNKLAFWPNDDTTGGLGIHFVQQALQRWEPRVEVVRLDAQRDPERPERLDVMLEYRVRATGRPGAVAVTVGAVAEAG